MKRGCRMKLRSPISHVAAILMSVALVGVACSKGSSQTGTLTLLTLKSSLLPDVTRPFTEANPTLKLQASTFITENEAVAKLQAGFKADVVYACLTDTQRLVSGGLSNPEIGAQLFISPRTVEYHLHKVFTALAIVSRAELPRVLHARSS